MSMRSRLHGQSRMAVEWNSKDGCSMVVQYCTAEDARTVAYALGLGDGAAQELLRLADLCDVENGEKVGDES